MQPPKMTMMTSPKVTNRREFNVKLHFIFYVKLRYKRIVVKSQKSADQHNSSGLTMPL